MKAALWSACLVVVDSNAQWLLRSGSFTGANQPHYVPLPERSKTDGVALEHLNDICIVLSAVVAGSASLCVLSRIAFDSSSGVAPDQKVSSSANASTLNMRILAKLPSAADKEITRLTCSSRCGEHPALIIASSNDGCVRAFRLRVASPAIVGGLDYTIHLAWMIAAVKSEINPWLMKPLPHMVDSEKKTALGDAVEGNDAIDQAWLQPLQNTELPQTAAAKSPGNAGNKLRNAVRNIGIISSVSHSRDMWLVGGASTSSVTTRWFNLHLDVVDIKRIIDSDKDALGHAIGASDVLPLLDFERSKSNPDGIEVLSCTVAINYGTIVFAGYVDGTFRIWKRISSLAPPSSVHQSVASMSCDDLMSRQVGVMHQFHCFRTLKLSDNSISDAIVTREGRCVIVCDAMGIQFAVSICGLNVNSKQFPDGFQFFSHLEAPFLFTAEHNIKVRMFVPPAEDAGADDNARSRPIGFLFHSSAVTVSRRGASQSRSPPPHSANV
jgi:hypothetical protein